MSTAKRREVLAACMGIFLVAGLLVVGFKITPANASPTAPEFKGVTQTPGPLVFDAPTERIRLVQEMDDPSSWRVAAAQAFICVPSGGVTCRQPSQYTPNTDLLSYVAPDVQNGQQRFIAFEGTIPNGLREFNYFFRITYDKDAGSADDLEAFNSWYLDSQGQPTGFGNIYSYGDMQLSITGDTSITPGSPLTVSGTMQCYGPVGPKAPDYGYVEVQFRLPGTTNWRYYDYAEYNPANGAWTYTSINGITTTADWRAVGYGNDSNGNQCEYDSPSPVLTVEAGTGAPPEPPPAPELPGAPGLVIADVTHTTAVLDWSPASGRGITGYRLGWTSASGKPVPQWSRIYTNPSDPFTMTNLNPDSDYVMYIEAVTATGVGARTSRNVHTDAAPVSTPTPTPTTPPTPTPTPPPPGPGPTPPPPPPPPPSDGGVAPSKPRAVKAVAGNHKARLSWKPPATKGTGGVVAYEVHVYGIPDVRLGAKARTYVWKKLKNNATYSLYVRAVSKAGPGPWVKRTARPSKR